jgi:hypothetical protein
VRWKLNEQNITLHDYGGKVETDCDSFIEGLIELLDELGDFGLSRIHKMVFSANPNINPKPLPKADIDHFMLTWYVALGELMFFSMKDEPEINSIIDKFYHELELSAVERNASPFLLEARISIPKIIARNVDFIDQGVVNRPTSNREQDQPRNSGLGPEIAKVIIDASVGTNSLVNSIYEEVIEMFETEFNNAYGHCSVACSTFTVTK